MVAHLDELLEIAAFDDYGPNGLQVPGRDETGLVVTGVSAHLELFERAAALDALVTGGPSEPAMADAAEGELTFVAGGHYATETFGVRALGELLAERFGVDHRFVAIPNPV